ncbi:class A beta-lactamase, subclass A2 [Mucilaginibacter sp. AW1-3]
MRTKFASILFLIFAFTSVSYAHQTDSLRNIIANIAQDAKGTVGVCMMNIETRDTVSYNGRLHLPMQSVMKFPIAITVLNDIDEGRFTLDEKVHVEKVDLKPDTYSPLRDKFPGGNIDISIRELLSYMVSLSDNNACDILLKEIGGTPHVENYMHSFGVKQIAVKATEYQMAQGWDVQFTNWTTPFEMVRLLDIANKPNFLSKESHAYLWKIMQETRTGPKQIKGLLPAGTIVAHKTGRSGTNDQGITAATNDVGIITLPNGKHLAIAIFVSNATTDLPTREDVMARIAKAVWDYEFSK